MGGEVVALPVGSRRVTYMPGPGGGLVYVQWDRGALVQGVSPKDLTFITETERKKGKAKLAGFAGPAKRKGNPAKADVITLPAYKWDAPSPKIPHRRSRLAQNVVGNVQYEVYANRPANTKFWLTASNVPAPGSDFGHTRASNGLSTTKREKADQWVSAVNEGRVAIEGRQQNPAKAKQKAKGDEVNAALRPLARKVTGGKACYTKACFLPGEEQ